MTEHTGDRGHKIPSLKHSCGVSFPMMIEQRVEIVSNQPISKHTWLMGLRSPEITEEARPGQFVMLRVGDGLDPLLRRPFSICGTRDDAFLLLYRVVGKGTALMTQLPKRVEISVLGPLGQGFDSREESVLPVLLGGGIGVAPLFFLAQAMRERDFRFLMGFPSEEEIITTERLGLPPLRVSVSTDDGSRGFTGLVTDLLSEELDMLPRQAKALTVFACGPKPMLKATAVMAMERGIPCQVSLEANMACGLGACQGCAVPAEREQRKTYFHVCQDGPVFPAEVIDWSEI